MSESNEQSVNEILHKCGVKVRLGKGLGSTEMMASATQTYEGCNETGSVGIPLVWINCKITEPGTTKELSYNCEGEICFSGPTLMLGYYNREDATNDIVKIHSDGERWIHTGDVGYISGSGFIYVTGRVKRIAMTRDKFGQVTKLFPDRIEKVIYTHKSVEACCVIGVPDETRINYPKAFIVMSDKENEEEKRSEILNICRKGLPEYMVPEEIEFVNDLPRTPRGKIDYKKLERQCLIKTE